MAGQTLSANAVAKRASTAAGRTVTDKQVRGVARATIGRFDKTKHPEYQAHAYSAAEASTIVATFAKRAGRTVRKVAKVAKVTRSTGTRKAAPMASDAV